MALGHRRPVGPRECRERRVATGHGGCHVVAVRIGIRRPAARAPPSHPDVLVTQHGCDTHMHDPLAHLTVISSDAQRQAHETLHDLAHEAADGRWVASRRRWLQLVDVVPRSWTHLTAIAAHVPVPAQARVPQEWLDHVEATMGRSAPTRMGDLPEESLPIWVQPWSMGHNPESPIDRAICT